MSSELYLLPGVPADYVRTRLAAAGGNEIESGKFFSPDSSSALAGNGLAWFHDRSVLVPMFQGTEKAGWPATRIEIEYCVRFPWLGGRHPWLDAFIETATHILGVESKRHEPFRDAKTASFSAAYDRPVWGDAMGPYEEMRDKLRTRELRFRHLDAAQLVKHAFGLITEAGRTGKQPILVYLYAEPSRWNQDALARHRDEAERFRLAVEGAAVPLVVVSWRAWLDSWPCESNAELAAHAARLRARFEL